MFITLPTIPKFHLAIQSRTHPSPVLHLKRNHAMHFSKFVIGSLLVLTSIVSSQVIITITSTITVITVTATVTPLSTSTSTKFVTVTGPSSPPHSTPTTSTRTVTVTASEPPTTSAATCPLGLGGSCGLWNPAPNGCKSCANGLTCRSIMWSSSRCDTNVATVITYTSTIYRA